MSTAMAYYQQNDFNMNYAGTGVGGHVQGAQPAASSYYYETKHLPSIYVADQASGQLMMEQHASSSSSSSSYYGATAAAPLKGYSTGDSHQQQQQQPLQAPAHHLLPPQQHLWAYPMQYSVALNFAKELQYPVLLSPASIDMDVSKSHHLQYKQLHQYHQYPMGIAGGHGADMAAGIPQANPGATNPNNNNNNNSANSSKAGSIDYSSIISCTISPSLKRRRKPKTYSMEVNQEFLCPQCEKVFQKPYNLKSHMKTHSTEKPYTCGSCNRKFARSHDKKRHEALHGGEKNFKCQGYLKDGTTMWGCGKNFARSDALLRHFRTESGWLCIKPLMDEAKAGDTTNPTLNQYGLSIHSLSQQVKPQELPLPSLQTLLYPQHQLPIQPPLAKFGGVVGSGLQYVQFPHHPPPQSYHYDSQSKLVPGK